MQAVLHKHRTSHIIDLALSLTSSFLVLSHGIPRYGQRGAVAQSCASEEVRACVGEAANETPLFVYYQRCRLMLGAEAHGHLYSGQQG